MCRKPRDNSPEGDSATKLLPPCIGVVHAMGPVDDTMHECDKPQFYDNSSPTHAPTCAPLIAAAVKPPATVPADERLARDALVSAHP